MNKFIPDTIKAFEQVVWLTEVHFRQAILGFEDKEYLFRAIFNCLNEGFNKSETIHFVRCFDCCSPNLEGLTAHKIMQSIAAGVVEREGHKSHPYDEEELTRWIQFYLKGKLSQSDLFVERDSRDTRILP